MDVELVVVVVWGVMEVWEVRVIKKRTDGKETLRQ